MEIVTAGVPEDDPVTVNVAVPLGVPVYVDPELFWLQPTSMAARATTARHIPNARRSLGARRHEIKAGAKRAARIAESLRISHGHGLRFDGGSSNFELDVEKIS